MAYEVWIPTRCESPHARLERVHNSVDGAQRVMAGQFATPKFVVGTGRLGHHLDIGVVGTNFLGSSLIVGIDLCSSSALIITRTHW